MICMECGDERARAEIELRPYAIRPVRVCMPCARKMVTELVRVWALTKEGKPRKPRKKRERVEAILLETEDCADDPKDSNYSPS